MMNRERSGEIEYVKPMALDLGALAIVYGATCYSGHNARACNAGGGEGEFPQPLCRTGYSPEAYCLNGTDVGAT